MRVYPTVIFSNGDLSQATLTSEVCDLNHMYGYALQCTFTGNAVGSVIVQGSCDPTDFNLTSRIVNWSTVVTLALGAPGSILYNVDASFYRWVRILYQRTSGSGSITANLNAKG